MEKKKLIIITTIAVIAVVVLIIIITVPIVVLLGKGPQIRVNQIGFVKDNVKFAYVISGKTPSQDFEIIDESGNSVFSGTLEKLDAGWNTKYHKAYRADFTEFQNTGIFQVKVEDSVSAKFTITATGELLYGKHLGNLAFFLQVQRDGNQVSSQYLNRQPSHLQDANAYIYEIPSYNADDILQGTLSRVGNQVRDVEGGWFDAGDYMKFVATTSYTLVTMLYTMSEYPDLQTWADFKLPQADDQLNVAQGDAKYYVKYRPIFRAGPGGSSISPNLAGRVSASFALCYRLFSGSNVTYAQTCLDRAIEIYSLADRSPSGQLLSVSPFSFYPEDEWESDMEFAAVQLYLATGTVSYLNDARDFANQKIAKDNLSPVNLYDIGPLAHYELAKLLTSGDSLRTSILTSVKKLLDNAVTTSQDDPFGLGLQYGVDDCDTIPCTFGYFLTAAFYDELASSKDYETFKVNQIDYVFGANGWGTSFVVGGVTDLSAGLFPRCIHHQIANTEGSLTSEPPILKGAVVSGPHTKDGNINTPDGARDCSQGDYEEFNAKGWTYSDTVGNYDAVEPALDYTVISILAYARMMYNWNK